ncbi:hypothetical protein SVIOM342S_07799 [Streptomyces violaceorubidus]
MSFTYDDVGATREQGHCPPGFRPLHVRTRLGEGEPLLRRAVEAVLTWATHREIGVGTDASAERAAPGVDVTGTMPRLRRAAGRRRWRAGRA